MIFCRFLFLVLLGLGSIAHAAKSEPSAPPFVARIQPGNFAEAQSLFAEDLARTNSIVILQTHAGRPISALALSQQSDGDFAVTLRAPPASPGGEWLTGSTPLSEPVARQVERAVAFTLNRNVLVTAVRRPPDDEDVAVWLFFRSPNVPDAAGIITWSSLLEQPAAKRFMNELIGPLQQLGGADDETRAKLLQQIDRVATEINLVSASSR